MSDKPLRLDLRIHRNLYAIYSLDANADVPEWASSGDFMSVVRTPEELSIVSLEGHREGGVKAEPGWRILEVCTELDFSMVGILSRLLEPLTCAGIGVFVVSSFKTDFILVRDQFVETVSSILRAAGHEVCTS